MAIGPSLALAAALALGACSGEATTDGEAAGAEVATPTGAKPPAPAFDPATATDRADYRGKFALVYANGEKGTATFLGDGTLTAEFSGTHVTANYTVPAPGQVCFDHVSTGDPPHCWRNGTANDRGAWTATMDDGSTLSVTPVD